MSEALKHWLKAKLDVLVNVRTCVIGQEIDLTVHLWSGVRAHIRFLHQAIKTRAIRKLLQEATDNGTGTLFILSPALVPSDGARLVPDEWLQAVHALGGERLYTYGFDSNGPYLFETHLEPSNTLNQLEAQHGAPIHFERIRFFRISLKPRFIKGDWLVADFDSPAFWKANDYRNHRARARSEQRDKTTWQPWGAYQRSWNGQDTLKSQAAPLKSYLDLCYELLELKPGADRDDLKAAFRRLAMQLHPDVSRLPKDEAEARFRLLSEAYEYIKAAHGWP